MSHLLAREDAGEVLSACRPGQRALVWYVDDHVYHERVLIWRVNDTTWYALTPDADMYAEDWSGTSEDGPRSFLLKGQDYEYLSRIRLPVYRFVSYPDDGALREHIETAFKELGNAATAVGAWRPRHVVNSKGQEVEATLFLGRLLVPRRVRRLGGGQIDEVPELGGADRDMMTRKVDPAPEGFVWLAFDHSSDFSLGSEIGDLRDSIKLDASTGVVRGPKAWTLIKLVKVTDGPEFVEQRETALRGLLKTPSSETVATPKQEVHVEGGEDVQEDARTLSVEFDDQGERYKPWRDLVKECREYGYPDWPHEGPQTVLHLLRHMLKNGGSPKQWLLIWARQKGIHDNDRVMHEMRALMEILESGGCYDQLNLPTLACMETVARRVQSIVDAYSSGSASSPDWGAARIITGYVGPDDLVSPAFRNWAARRGKEEVELAQARTKIREHKRLTVPTEEAAAAVADGNLPGAAPVKPKRKARAKALAAPPDS